MTLSSIKAQDPPEFKLAEEGFYLDLSHVSLLLAIADGKDLGVGNHSDDCAVLLQLLKLSLYVLLAISVLLGIVAECPLLALEPTVEKQFEASTIL